jgi:hypothetical protein
MGCEKAVADNASQSGDEGEENAVCGEGINGRAAGKCPWAWEDAEGAIVSGMETGDHAGPRVVRGIEDNGRTAGNGEDWDESS